MTALLLPPYVWRHKGKDVLAFRYGVAPNGYDKQSWIVTLWISSDGILMLRHHRYVRNRCLTPLTEEYVREKKLARNSTKSLTKRSGEV